MANKGKAPYLPPSIPPARGGKVKRLPLDGGSLGGGENDRGDQCSSFGLSFRNK